MVSNLKEITTTIDVSTPISEYQLLLVQFNRYLGYPWECCNSVIASSRYWYESQLINLIIVIYLHPALWIKIYDGSLKEIVTHMS